jgi:hypothetical protein
LFPLDIPEQAACEVVVQCLIDQVEGIAELLSKQDVETSADALGTLTRAWPTFVTECRSVLGSERHTRRSCTTACEPTEGFRPGSSG